MQQGKLRALKDTKENIKNDRAYPYEVSDDRVPLIRMNMMITILMQCALNNLELYVVTSKPNNGKFNHVLNFGKQLQRL